MPDHVTIPVWTPMEVATSEEYIIFGGVILPVGVAVGTTVYVDMTAPDPTYVACEATDPTYTACTAPMPTWVENEA